MNIHIPAPNSVSPALLRLMSPSGSTRGWIPAEITAPAVQGPSQLSGGAIWDCWACPQPSQLFGSDLVYSGQVSSPGLSSLTFSPGRDSQLLSEGLQRDPWIAQSQQSSMASVPLHEHSPVGFLLVFVKFPWGHLPLS